MKARAGAGRRRPAGGKAGHGEVRRRAGSLLMSVLLALSQVLGCLGGSLAPVAAYAADSVPSSITVGTSEPYDSGDMWDHGVNSHRFTTTDGTVMYCADANSGTPNAGETFTDPVAGGRILDYIIYYGFGGTAYDGRYSQSETQCAVWWYMYENGDGNTNSAFTSKAAADGGHRLYCEARDNATEDGPYSGSTWVYSTSRYGVQRVIGQTLRHGALKLHKSSSNPSITDGNGCYSLAGAVYEVYDSGMSHVGTLTTGESGDTNTLEGLSAGTYYVWERSASKGYLTCDGSDGATNVGGYWYHRVDVSLGRTTTVECSEPVGNDPEFMTIHKQDADTGKAMAQGDADLSGAEFEVRYYATMDPATRSEANLKRKWVLKTDSQGFTSLNYALSYPETYLSSGDEFYVTNGGTATLPYGTITVQEVSAPKGYTLNGNADVHVMTIDADGVHGDFVSEGVVSNVRETAIRGGVSTQKIDHERDDSVAQGDATLAGAEFQITNESAHDVVVDGARFGTGDVVRTIAANEQGIAATDADELPYGTYSIRETKAPTGYRLNGSWSQTFSVRGNGAVSDLTADGDVVADEVVRGDVALAKVDRELGEGLPLGSATLAGAEVTITNDSAGAVRVDGVDYQPGEVVRTLVTDEAGTASTSGGALPFGTYTLRESKAPTGYRLNEGWSRTIHVREDGVTVDLTGSDGRLDDQAKRGDIRLVKADEDSQDRMPGVAFSLTSKTTGESHVLVTDENGMIDTSAVFASHEDATNANDAALSEDGTVDSSKLDAAAGVWFSGRTDRQTTPNDSLGALPYDTYELKELRCSANEAHRLVSMTVRVSRAGYTLDLGTFDDKQVNLGTTLTYGDGGKVAPASASVDLTDSVRFEGLAAGATYTFRGELHAIDSEGNDRGVVATAERQVQPRFQADTEEMTFRGVDTSSLGGMRLVAYEWVLDGDDVLASHTEKDDEGQTVRVPRLGTTMAGDLDHESDATAETIRLTDTVSYENLEPGREYDVTGTLHYRNADGTDGGEVTDGDGNPVSASTKVTPDTWSGTCEVTFEFSGVGLSGRTVVAFEEAARDGVTYCTHADITDAGQTVSFPSVATTAASASTGDHDAPLGGTQVVTDEVRLSNLVVGHEYTVTGTLHLVGEDGSDAGVATDGEGNDSTATTTFTADAADKTVGLEFRVSTDELAGRDTVAFEELSRDGVRLGAHADITDEGQTVSVPGVHTTLTDALTGAQDLQAKAAGTITDASDEAAEDGRGTKVTLVDSVAYENLIAGRQYAVTGTLHVRSADGSDAGTLRDADGNDVTATATFTPEAPDGTVDVTFDVDLSQVDPGTKVVTFEDLSRDGIRVATHSDIADEGQTVTVTAPPQVTTEYPNTGQGPAALALLGAGGAGAVAFAAHVARTRRRRG